MSAATEAEITEWIASQKHAMIDLLRDAVNIDSGSYDKPASTRRAARPSEIPRRTASPARRAR